MLNLLINSGAVGIRTRVLL